MAGQPSLAPPRGVRGHGFASTCQTHEVSARSRRSAQFCSPLPLHLWDGFGCRARKSAGWLASARTAREGVPHFERTPLRSPLQEIAYFLEHKWGPRLGRFRHWPPDLVPSEIEFVLRRLGLQSELLLTWRGASCFKLNVRNIHGFKYLMIWWNSFSFLFDSYIHF